MGLEAQPLPGGRCLIATLPLGPEPFPTLGNPRSVKAVRFVTVGSDRIKCLVPRALFYLPLIPISDCENLGDLEVRIRQTWGTRLAQLESARAWLDQLGIEAEAPQDTPQWIFALGETDPEARAACIESGRVILPSRGPLSGVWLRRIEQRSFAVGPALTSAVDVEIALTTRLEELARLDRRRQEHRRRHTREPALLPAPPAQPMPRLLLVGPGLAVNRALQDSLHLRGFRVTAARSIQEAIAAFQQLSYHLILAEVRLDRGDGVELLPALGGVAGVTQLPVVLVDERARDASREAARRAGAAGYLAQPIDLAKVTPALVRLAQAPRERRFTRYRQPLAVAWRNELDAGVTATVGRGGIFVRTDRGLPIGTCTDCEIHLPEFGTNLVVGAEVVYALDGTAASDRGLGLRFRHFSDENEPIWVAYLRSLEVAPRRS